MFENIKMEIFIERILLKHWQWFYGYVLCINKFDTYQFVNTFYFFSQIENSIGNISTTSFNIDQCNQQQSRQL